MSNYNWAQLASLLPGNQKASYRLLGMALKIFTGAKPFLKAQFITEIQMLPWGQSELFN